VQTTWRSSGLDEERASWSTRNGACGSGKFRRVYHRIDGWGEMVRNRSPRLCPCALSTSFAGPIQPDTEADAIGDYYQVEQAHRLIAAFRFIPVGIPWRFAASSQRRQPRGPRWGAIVCIPAGTDQDEATRAAGWCTLRSKPLRWWSPPLKPPTDRTANDSYGAS
jgi:hypothetical protein